VLRNRLGKCHFQALRVPETRNRPLIGAAERPSANTGPGTCSGTPIRRMWQLELEIQNGNLG
jgi:hypothetical protein